MILDPKEPVLRTKTIPTVKVLWRDHALIEATWEVEPDIKEKYLDYLSSKFLGQNFPF